MRVNKSQKVQNNSKICSESCYERDKVIAVIPAYNEEKNIASIILEIEKYVDTIIVVDDGSVDHTGEIARRMGAIVIYHGRNLGKGAALLTGFKKALEVGSDTVVTLDADGQHDPKYIPELIKPILMNKADLVIGSRFIKGGASDAPKYRQLGLRILNFLVRRITGSQVKDTQSGFRALNRKALEIMTKEMTARGYAVEQEQLKIAIKHRLKIVEVPVIVKYNVEKPSKKNPIAHAITLIMNLIELVALEEPLACLGLPGTICLIAGIGFTTHLVWLFNRTRYFSVPIAILALGALLLGMMLVTSAITLYTLKFIARKLGKR